MAMRDHDGEALVTLAGIGSLMSEVSARRTFPLLRNFRPGLIRGCVRVFNIVSISAISRGFANTATNEVAAVACRRLCDSQHDHANGDSGRDRLLPVSLFEICWSEMDSYFEREHR